MQCCHPNFSKIKKYVSEGSVSNRYPTEWQCKMNGNDWQHGKVLLYCFTKSLLHENKTKTTSEEISEIMLILKDLSVINNGSISQLI